MKYKHEGLKDATKIVLNSSTEIPSKLFSHTVITRKNGIKDDIIEILKRFDVVTKQIF